MVFGLVLIFAIGCGKEPQFTGTVYVNDKIVELGTLKFTPELTRTDAGATIIAQVEEGELRFIDDAASTQGKNIVKLTVSRDWLTGKGGDNPSEAFVTLSQDFDLPEPGGNIELKFEYDLESK